MPRRGSLQGVAALNSLVDKVLGARLTFCAAGKESCYSTGRKFCISARVNVHGYGPARMTPVSST